MLLQITITLANHSYFEQCQSKLTFVSSLNSNNNKKILFCFLGQSFVWRKKKMEMAYSIVSAHDWRQWVWD